MMIGGDQFRLRPFAPRRRQRRAAPVGNRHRSTRQTAVPRTTILACTSRQARCRSAERPGSVRGL